MAEPNYNEQTITNRTEVIVLSVRHSRLWNWTGD